jgi:ferric-dicitrate binding protein FerR (iron transport regulator)
MTNQPRDRWQQLFDDWCDGTISAADARELDQQLAGDADARREFLRYVELHGLLQVGDAVMGTIEQPSPTRGSLRSLVSPAVRLIRRPTPLSMTVAALVIGLLITAMAFMAPPVYRKFFRDLGGEASYEIVANVTDLQEAVWTKREIGTFVGAHLVAGRELQLQSGFVELTFKDGARTVIEGPATFRVDSRNSGSLQRGKLVAHVTERAKGFSIRTNDVVITDLGTEFGVHVDDGGSCEVHVFRGIVELASRQRNANRDGAFRLLAGEAVHFPARGPSQHLVANANDFVHRLRPSAVVGGEQRHLVYDPQLGGDIAVGKFGEASPPTVSTTDLGASAVVSSVDVAGKIGATFLNNGQLGDANVDACNVTSGSEVTFTFDTTTNTAGYDITEIATYAGWSTQAGGRSNQGYQIDLHYVDGSSATLVGPVSFVRNNPAAFWTIVVNANRAGSPLENDRGVVASGVKAITWKNFNAANAGGVVVYREFDVFGSPTRREGGP